MAQVEDVAGAVAEAVKDTACFALDDVWVGQHDGGVEVALQGDAVADATSGFCHVHGPVHTQALAAGIGEQFQVLAAAFAE